VKIIRTAAVLLFLLTASGAFAEAYPPEGWTDDLLEAIRESEETGKDILLNFTGSDWCVWCHKLWDEVFNTAEFEEYAGDNLILVFLDFPNDVDQPEDTVKQNQVLASLFGVQGFPTIWLMDSTLLPVIQTGYREGGGESYVTHLKNDRLELEEAKEEEFRTIVREGIREYIGAW